MKDGLEQEVTKGTERWTGPMPEGITMGDKYGPAMEITDPAEARKYFKMCVDHTRIAFEKTREEAEVIERSNLGYYAGYYDHATRLRVEKLFECAHPVFGKAAERVPTAEEALAAGISMAKAKGGA